MEKSFAGFPRSYPDGMGEDEQDALAYSPAGFIWDNAVKHGVSILELRRIRHADLRLEGPVAQRVAEMERLLG